MKKRVIQSLVIHVEKNILGGKVILSKSEQIRFMSRVNNEPSGMLHVFGYLIELAGTINDKQVKHGSFGIAHAIGNVPLNVMICNRKST